MTWGRVGRIYAVLVVLAAYVVVFEVAETPVDPKNLPPTAEESLLEAEPSALVSLTFRRGAEEVHAVRDAERWQVLRPVNAQVSHDLLSALAGTLTAGQSAEVMMDATAADLAEFGLVEPSSEIEVALQGRPQAIQVLLGALNPTGTAIYAKRSDREMIFLIGLNVRYYTDLVLAGARASG